MRTFHALNVNAIALAQQVFVIPKVHQQELVSVNLVTQDDRVTNVHLDTEDILIAKFVHVTLREWSHTITAKTTVHAR